jgi:hypothetical protein
VDETGSRSHALAGFTISGVKPTGSTTTVIVKMLNEIRKTKSSVYFSTGIQ